MKEEKRILFVCHGNICRSAMAEYICKYLRPDLYCESRAVSYEEQGNDIYPDAKRCLNKHNIPFDRHYARRIEADDYDKFDKIYVMDRSNLSRISRIIDDYDKKVEMLNDRDIEDPWYTGNFEKVYNELVEGIKKI